MASFVVNHHTQRLLCRLLQSNAFGRTAVSSPAWPVSANGRWPFQPHAFQLLVQCLRKSTSIDPIDCFTNELVVRKSTKWKRIRDRLTDDATSAFDESQPTAEQLLSSGQLTLRATAKRILQDLHGLRHDGVSGVRYCVDIRPLGPAHIDQLLRSALLDEHAHDFYSIVDECLHCERLPTDAVVVEVLRYLVAHSAHTDYPERWLLLLAERRPDLNGAMAEFGHVRARLRWLRGERREALRDLGDAYARMRNANLTRMADSMRAELREAVRQSVRLTDADDEALDAVEELALRLSATFGDDRMLADLWRGCFVSEWFGHQRRAVRLFEQNDEIRTLVGQKTSLLCYQLLNEHNTDAIYRMIELLLKFDMKLECRTCLSFLFDYQYWRRDLRACSEIMRSSLDIDAPLSDVQNQKLLNLLLGNAANANEQKPKTPIDSAAKFQLKF